MGNTKNLENEKDIKCPECGANGTATGELTPDGDPMYCCESEECGALFIEQGWLTCQRCHQQGELTSEVTDDGFEVCLCKNPGCSEISFAGRKVEEVQVSYTTKLTGDEVWDVCPTCGKVGRNTGEVNSGGRIVFACENEECPEKVYAGRTQEEITAAVEEPFDWRKRLDELKEIMQGCMAAAVEIIPGDVDPDEEFSVMKYGALCHTRSDCALALFRVLTAETAHVMELVDKAAAMLEDMDKKEKKAAAIMILPEGLMPPMPPAGEQC